MDSIIFDLDGTLWDSRETVVEAWNKVLRENNYSDKELTTADLKKTMGLQMDKIGEILFPEVPVEKRNEIIQKWGSTENTLLKEKGGTLYPEMKETVEQLAKKYTLFIVSNCQEGYIESFLEFYQMEELFADFENPGRTGLSKGENIKLVIERNKLQAPVYVGDTNWDQESAVYAGIPFVYASYGFGQVEDYDYQVNSFAELKRLFL